MEFLFIGHYAAPSFSRGESDDRPSSTGKVGVAECAGCIFLPLKTIPVFKFHVHGIKQWTGWTLGNFSLLIVHFRTAN